MSRSVIRCKHTVSAEDALLFYASAAEDELYVDQGATARVYIALHGSDALKDRLEGLLRVGPVRPCRAVVGPVASSEARPPIALLPASRGPASALEPKVVKVDRWDTIGAEGGE